MICHTMTFKYYSTIIVCVALLASMMSVTHAQNIPTGSQQAPTSSNQVDLPGDGNPDSMETARSTSTGQIPGSDLSSAPIFPTLGSATGTSADHPTSSQPYSPSYREVPVGAQFLTSSTGTPFFLPPGMERSTGTSYLTPSMEAPTGTPFLPPGMESATGTQRDAGQPKPLQESKNAITQKEVLPEDQEDVVVSSTDTPAVRLRKLARYWAVYREIGSQSMYAITVSGTKREIKTWDFFTKIESNFGMRLMPKGSLDQFTTGDAITSVDGLDFKSFRKLAEPCRLIKTADKPAVYLACLGIKRAIKNEQAFKQFGWDFKQVQSVRQGDVDQLKEGEFISESTVFDQGVTIEQPTIQQQPIMGQQQQRPKQSSPPAGTVKYDVVKTQGDSKLFVLSADGKLHQIPNLETLRALRIDTSNPRVLTADQLKQYAQGESMSAIAGTPGMQIQPSPMPAGASTYSSSTMGPLPAPQIPVQR